MQKLHLSADNSVLHMLKTEVLWQFLSEPLWCSLIWHKGQSNSSMRALSSPKFSFTSFSLNSLWSFLQPICLLFFAHLSAAVKMFSLLFVHIIVSLLHSYQDSCSLCPTLRMLFSVLDCVYHEKQELYLKFFINDNDHDVLFYLIQYCWEILSWGIISLW